MRRGISWLQTSTSQLEGGLWYVPRNFFLVHHSRWSSKRRPNLFQMTRSFPSVTLLLLPSSLSSSSSASQPYLPPIPITDAHDQVNKETQTAENLYYKNLNPSSAPPSRREQAHGLLPHPVDTTVTTTAKVPDDAKTSEIGQPPYLFSKASELLKLCATHNLSIAQLVWENELAFRSGDEIRAGLLKCTSL